ncbi:MAG: hypothetical protein N3F07_03300 [Candidatus Micrarchaeota archaeon]|nr:hypothetical protein [Candidatus Micrarchaeota archaeon]
MYDIVMAKGLRCAKGIEENLLAESLKAFRQAKTHDDLEPLAKVKNVLLHFPQYELDEGACRQLAKSNGCLVFAFCDILAERGFRRGILISKMRLAAESCRKAGCGYVFCTLARGEHELRTARELRSFMAILGLSQHEICFAQEKAKEAKK